MADMGDLLIGCIRGHVVIYSGSSAASMAEHGIRVGLIIHAPHLSPPFGHADTIYQISP